MTTVIYLRLSRADENNAPELIRDSDSIKNQRDLLTSFILNHAELQETKIIEICDDGYSGTNFNRPGIKRMLELAKTNEINCIVVKDFSRFGRNYIESGDYIERLFPFMGIRFISVNDGYDSSTEDRTAGNLNVAFMNLIHDLYSKDLSDKVKTAQRTKWEKGENIAGHPIFGYIKSKSDKHKLIIDEPAAVVIRQIFNMAVTGNNTTEIARLLNEQNISTPNMHKRDFLNCKRDWKQTDGISFWTKSIVYRIISDERYIGTAIYGKHRNIEVGSKKRVNLPRSEWVIKENAFEAIISKDIFIEAQKNLFKYLPVPKQKIQRTLYNKVYCANCRRVMQRRNYKNPVFVCETPKYTHSPDCVHEQILESRIEGILFETIRKQIEVFTESGKSGRDKSVSPESKTTKISAQIQESYKFVQQSTRNRLLLYEKYKDGKISRDEYMIERETLTSQIDSREKQIQILKLEFEQPIYSNTNFIEQKYTQFRGIEKLTREMVDTLIESVFVYNDSKIEIRFNTADEFLNFTNCK